MLTFSALEYDHDWTKALEAFAEAIDLPCSPRE